MLVHCATNYANAISVALSTTSLVKKFLMKSSFLYMGRRLLVSHHEEMEELAHYNRVHPLRRSGRPSVNSFPYSLPQIINQSLELQTLAS